MGYLVRIALQGRKLRAACRGSIGDDRMVFGKAKCAP